MKPLRPHFSRSGFTLLEVMFVVVTMSILSITVVTTFLFLQRAAAELTAYRSTSAAARQALAALANDIRSGQSAAVSSNGTLLIAGGSVGQAAPVRYGVEARHLVRWEGDAKRVLCGHLRDFQFDVMTRDGQPVAEVGAFGLVRATLLLEDAQPKGVTTNRFSLLVAMRNGRTP